MRLLVHASPSKRSLASCWLSQMRMCTQERLLTTSTRVDSWSPKWRWVASHQLQLLVSSNRITVNLLRPPSTWCQMFLLVLRSLLRMLAISSKHALSKSRSNSDKMLSSQLCIALRLQLVSVLIWNFSSTQKFRPLPFLTIALALWSSHTLFHQVKPVRLLTVFWRRDLKFQQCKCSILTNQLLQSSWKSTEVFCQSSTQFAIKWQLVQASWWRFAKKTQ